MSETATDERLAELERSVGELRAAPAVAPRDRHGFRLDGWPLPQPPAASPDSWEGRLQAAQKRKAQERLEADRAEQERLRAEREAEGERRAQERARAAAELERLDPQVRECEGQYARLRVERHKLDERWGSLRERVAVLRRQAR